MQKRITIWRLKKSELEKISKAKKAEADAAYKIQEEKSRKEIEVVTADANIMRQEKEIELKRKDVEVTEQTLDAQIKKQAEAEKYASQQRADADLYKRQKSLKLINMLKKKKLNLQNMLWSRKLKVFVQRV